MARGPQACSSTERDSSLLADLCSHDARLQTQASSDKTRPVNEHTVRSADKGEDDVH